MTDWLNLIDEYVVGPQLLQEAVSNMTPMEIATPSPPGRWSTHAIVCHIADFEVINAERLMRILAEDRPTVFNAEPAPFVAALNYSARPFPLQMALISSIRAHMATILRGLGPEQTNRTGFHSTDGELTLAQIVERVTRHIPHHVAYITEKKLNLRG